MASQGGNLSYTLPQLQATHPDAANNLAVDPLFTDEASRVFGLRAGSPAIDRGLLIPGVGLPWDGSGFGGVRRSMEGERHRPRPLQG